MEYSKHGLQSEELTMGGNNYDEMVLVACKRSELTARGSALGTE
jgi:hypothetical protein